MTQDLVTQDLVTQGLVTLDPVTRDRATHDRATIKLPRGNKVVQHPDKELLQIKTYHVPGKVSTVTLKIATGFIGA